MTFCEIFQYFVKFSNILWIIPIFCEFFQYFVNHSNILWIHKMVYYIKSSAELFLFLFWGLAAMALFFFGDKYFPPFTSSTWQTKASIPLAFKYSNHKICLFDSRSLGPLTSTNVTRPDWVLHMVRSGNPLLVWRWFITSLRQRLLSCSPVKHLSNERRWFRLENSSQLAGEADTLEQASQRSLTNPHSSSGDHLIKSASLCSIAFFLLS